MSTKKPRIAIRDAVENVIGPTGSAVVGDELFDELRAAGWELYRPDECIAAAVDGFTVCPEDNLPAALGRFHLVPAESSREAPSA